MPPVTGREDRCSVCKLHESAPGQFETFDAGLQIVDNISLVLTASAMQPWLTERGEKMPQTIYCWRCKIDVPMLTEDEWQMVKPETLLEQIKQYRTETGTSLADAYRSNTALPALAAYERITGFRESNANALMHHRLKLYGPACTACGKPIRTPTASFCAECGATRRD